MKGRRKAGPALGALGASGGRRPGRSCPSHSAFSRVSWPRDWQWAPGYQQVRAGTDRRRITANQGRSSDLQDRLASAMRSLTGLRALLLLCLLAAMRPDPAEGDPTGAWGSGEALGWALGARVWAQRPRTSSSRTSFAARVGAAGMRAQAAAEQSGGGFSLAGRGLP